jgi:hypothetical protein
MVDSNVTFPMDDNSRYRYHRAHNAVEHKGDPTWKERNAKGTPVKIPLDSNDGFNKRIQWYSLDGELDSHLIDDDSPYVVVFGSQSYRKSGRFCNFRYKQKQQP